LKLFLLAIKKCILNTLDIIFIGLIPSFIIILLLTFLLKIFSIKIMIFTLFITWGLYLFYIIGVSLSAIQKVLEDEKNDK
jgi:hypothetical protein